MYVRKETSRTDGKKIQRRTDTRYKMYVKVCVDGIVEKDPTSHGRPASFFSRSNAARQNNCNQRPQNFISPPTMDRIFNEGTTINSPSLVSEPILACLDHGSRQPTIVSSSSSQWSPRQISFVDRLLPRRHTTPSHVQEQRLFLGGPHG